MEILRSLLVLGILVGTPAWAGPRVAVVQSDDLDPYTEPVPSFLEELGEPAMVLNIHGRAVEARAVAKKLKREQPDVVFALGSKAAYTVRHQLPDTPMVYAVVINPDRYGIPGERAVGIEATVSPSRYLSQFVGFFPEVRTIGVLRGPLTTDDRMAELQGVARTLDLTLLVEEIGTPRRVRRAFNEMAPNIDALWLQPDREMMTAESFRLLTEEARRRRLPLLVETDNMVRAGALFAVVPDPDGLGRQAARTARQLLDGASPRTLHDEFPSEVLVVLNMRTVERAEIPFDALLLDFVDVVVE
jgi:putative ABC transport system substrate-binding protein